MILTNKTEIFAAMLMGLVLLTAGCVSGRDFSQEDAVEDAAVDIVGTAQAASTGTGASIPVPVAADKPPV